MAVLFHLYRKLNWYVPKRRAINTVIRVDSSHFVFKRCHLHQLVKHWNERDELYTEI